MCRKTTAQYTGVFPRVRTHTRTVPASTRLALAWHSPTHPCTHVPIHSRTHPPTHPSIHSLTLTHSHSHTHPITHALTHPLTHSPTHSLTHSHTHALAHSLTHSLTSTIHPPTGFIVRPCKADPIHHRTHPLVQAAHANPGPAHLSRGGQIIREAAAVPHHCRCRQPCGRGSVRRLPRGIVRTRHSVRHLARRQGNAFQARRSCAAHLVTQDRVLSHWRSSAKIIQVLLLMTPSSEC
jgi:hypothetical protein